MKPFYLSLSFLLSVVIFSGCSSSGSQEQTSQDSLKTDSLSTQVQPTGISDSDFDNLKKEVDRQFDQLYKDVTDTSSYFKVVVFTNYNEYEGQSEAWETEYYFNKQVALRYFKEIHQSGAVREPDMKEYILSTRSITCAREEEPYSGVGRGTSYTIWTEKSEAIRSSKKVSAETINESLSPSLKDKRLADVQAHLDMIRYVLTNGKKAPGDSVSVVIILTETKEDSDLLDSTKIFVPKKVYEQFKTKI